MAFLKKNIKKKSLRLEDVTGDELLADTRAAGFGLKWQLLLFVFVLLAAGMGASAYFRLSEGYESRKSFLYERAYIAFDTLAESISAPLWYLNYQSVDKALDKVALLDGIYRITLETGDGKIFVRDHRDLDNAPSDVGSSDLTPPKLPLSERGGVKFITPQEEIFLLEKDIVWTELSAGGDLREIKIGRLTFEVSIKQAEDYLRQAIHETLIFHTLLFLILMTMVWFVISKLTDPMARLTNIMGRIGNLDKDGNLETFNIPYLHEKNELGELSRSLDILKSRSVELFELRDNLEEKVLLQTVELSKSKDVAEAASLAKTNLLTNVSHELRTPLNAVMGMSQILKRTDLNENQHEYVNLILNSGDALLILISDLLDMAQLETKDLILKKAPFQLANITAGVRSHFADRLQASKTQLRVRNDFTASEWFHGDLQRIKQILFALVSNAVKFTESGKITLSVSVERDADNINQLTIFVEDSGIGISDDNKAHLFDSFTQVDNDLSRKFQGLGAGLSLVSALVGLMKGGITVDSDLDHGSVFTIVLPLGANTAAQSAAFKAAAAEVDALPHDKRASLKVLVAEDNPVNKMLLLKILEQVGHRVTTVSDGQLAVASVEEDDFDIILMDIQMPTMDGLTAFRLIRALPGGKGDIPIIAVTANTLQQDRDRYVKEGFNGFIGKPISPRALLSVMDKLCSAETEDDNSSVPAKSDPERSNVVHNRRSNDTLENEIKDVLKVALMDARQWEEMSNAIGVETLHELMATLPAELDKYCNLLKELSAADDMAGFKREVHALKGLASNSALARLAKIAGMMNKSANNGVNPKECMVHLDAVMVDSHRILSEKLKVKNKK